MSNTFSVVIACFATERWPDTLEAVESVRDQTLQPQQIILVVDHNDDLFARAQQELHDVLLLKNEHQRGAAGARNTGSSAAVGDLLVFLDDDAVASNVWLATMASVFDDEKVLGAGGGIEPIWVGQPRPRWFPLEFGWVVGASYSGGPTEVSSVRNVWSGNMAVRRTAFEAIGGFRADFSKVGNRSRPEDTELCVRLSQQFPGGLWKFVPDAMVGHKVPGDRTTPRFFLRRCLSEGTGKAEMAGLLGWPSLRTETIYGTTTVPVGIFKNLAALLRGDSWGIIRAGMMVFGLAATAFGAALGLTRTNLAVLRRSRTAA